MKLRIFIAGLILMFAQASQATVYSDLNVTVSAGGQVSSVPAGISCPGTCDDGNYVAGTPHSVTLTATAFSGYTFTGWGGDCSGTSTCMVNMTTDHMVTASFSSGSQAQIVPETGFWYSATEGGRGYVIEEHANNNLFIGGFMYDANGNAIWYASGPSPMSGPATYTGQWQQYGNGETLTGAYVASAIVNPAVGAITLQFQSTTTATLTLPDGRQISLIRFPF